MSEIWETLIIKDKDGIFYAHVGDIRAVKKKMSIKDFDGMDSEKLKKLLSTKDIQSIKYYATRVDCAPQSKSITYDTQMTKTQYLKDMEAGVFKSRDDKDKIQRAIDVASSYGSIDGAHHKMWVIDQMVRILIGSETEYLKQFDPEDEEYSWDVGCSP